MHIVHLTSGHEANDTRIVKKQCASLAELGFQVTLVARQPDIAMTMPDGVNLVSVPRSTGGRLSRFVSTARAVVNKAETIDGDIFHFHDPDLLPFCLMLAKRGKRVFYDVHEDYRASIYDRKWIPFWLQSLASKGVAMLEQSMGANGWVVAATPHIASYFDKDRTVIVQNFPNFKEFSKDRKVTPYRNRGHTIIYVGAVTEERGALEILNALPLIAQNYPDIECKIVGNAAEPFLKKLKSMDGWKWVTYYGFQDRNTVVDLLYEARIGLVTLKDVPRYRLSQPTKMFEYMAASLPVLASDFEVWKNKVGNNVGEFIEPQSQRIASSVMKLFEDEQLAEKMGKQGAKIVHEKFNWQNDLNALVELYKRIMES